MLRIFIIMITLLSLSYGAGTSFLLTTIKSIYPVITIHSKLVGSEYKKIILQNIKEAAESVGIDTSGYSQRSMKILIDDVDIADEKILEVSLIVGEEVKRIDDGEEVFATTYMNSAIFKIEDLEEDLLDNVDSLLYEFVRQYKEDNE